MKASNKNPECDPRTKWWLLSVVTATAIGFLLRIYRLDTQFPTGDEWHALIVGVNFNFSDILTSFFGGGHSIPEALYYRVLMKVGSVTESTIYAPFVLVGTVMIGAVPFLIRNLVGRRTSAFLAWLIALSPFFLFYSRFARPYGIVAALSFVAIWNFERWVETRSSRYLVGYGMSAALSSYFHLIALPFVLTPIIVALFRDAVLTRAGVAASIRNAILASLAAGLPIVVFLGAPVWNSFSAVAGKAAQGMPTVPSVFDGYMILVGSRELPIVIVITAFALVGVWAMIQNRQLRIFAILLLTSSAVQLVTVIMSRPLAVEGPHIFARYLIPVALVLLVFTSAGFQFATRRLPRFPTAGIAGLMLAVYFLNTSSWVLTRYNTETSEYLLVYLIVGKDFERFPLDNVRHKVPAFYEWLSRRPPGEMTIVEAPFLISEYFLVTYQLLHRQRVLMGLTERLCGPGTDLQGNVFKTYERTRIRNVVDLSDPGGLAAKGVDYVVFHRSIHAETAIEDGEFADADVTRCIDYYLNNVASAVFDDGNVVAFAISKRARQFDD
jgi:Dolichyl-phosphate-mannose-protein mannosyltransferase